MSVVLTTATPMRGSSASRPSASRPVASAPSMPNRMDRNGMNPVYVAAAQHAKTRWLGTVDSKDLCIKSTGIFGAERVTTGSLGEHLT
jgi:hypothetical protein